MSERCTELSTIKESLNRLTSIYISQDIDRETFLSQKEALLSKKMSLQEADERQEKRATKTWLESFKEWIITAKTLDEIAPQGASQEKKRAAEKVFGSNLLLEGKKPVVPE